MTTPVLLAALVLLAADEADSRTWTLDRDLESPAAHLFYGTPDSDDLAIGLSCRLRSGEILVGAPVDDDMGRRLEGDRWVDRAGRPAPWSVRVTFTSGAQSLPVQGQAQADEMNGGVTVEARLPASSPVAKAFAASGDLRLSALGKTVSGPPAPPATARAFVAACAP